MATGIMKIDTSAGNSNRWYFSPTTSFTIESNGKYLDRNIYINLPAGAATTPTNSTALSSTSTSLSGTTLTVQASVVPTITDGYVSQNSGVAGTVKIKGTVPTEEKTPSLTTSEQTITPTSGKLISKVTIPAVTSTVASNLLGIAVLGSEGSVSTAPSVTIGGTTNMSTASSGTYYFTRTGVANNGTVQTKYKATTAGYTPTVSATNGGTVTVTPGKTADATIYIPTAAGSVTMSAGSGSITHGSNITTATSDTYSCALSMTGSGSVSATAKITTAGYTPTNNSFATGSSTSSSTATKYITGITIPAGKTFGSTSAKGAITLAAGTSATAKTKAYLTMNNNTVLYLTDAVTGKTWTITCDSINNALTIEQ